MNPFGRGHPPPDGPRATVTIGLVKPLHVSDAADDGAMSVPGVMYSISDVVEFIPEPISPAWILAGSPVARAAPLTRTADGRCWTALWECTSGRFKWRYGIDETVLILEGQVRVTWPGNITRTLMPGDVAFFASGSEAEWDVSDYVKKMAFLRSKRDGFRRVLRRVPFARKVLVAAKRAVGGTTTAMSLTAVVLVPRLAEPFMALIQPG